MDAAMSKYEPLGNFLSALETQRWRASFAEIEAVLGFPLPRSAYTYPAWWSNDETGHSHARAWLGAGWRTEDVDVPARTVTLVREGARAVPKSQRFGCMKGTFWIDPNYDLTAPLGRGLQLNALSP
jgi:hypothetical protein